MTTEATNRIFTMEKTTTMIIPKRLIFFLAWIILTIFQSVDATNSTDISNPIDRLMTGYRRDIRPYANEGVPVTISFEMQVTQMGSIDAVKMSFAIDIHLRQRWNDPRLAFTESNRSVELNYKQLDDLWLPQAYIRNLLSGKKHEITVPNIYIGISPQGDVLSVQRYNLLLACNMDLTFYPMDQQICNVEIESYGATTNNVIYVWRDVNEPVTFNSDLELPEFSKQIGTQLDSCMMEYTSGSFPCVMVKFTLKREFGYYLIQTFIPTILIVMLSWLSFWLDTNATPARISLGLLTVLTMTTQTSGIVNQLPKVSYIKAIDIWMSMCLAFVFSALVEFAVVNVKARREEENTKTQNSTHPVPREGIVNISKTETESDKPGTDKDDTMNSNIRCLHTSIDEQQRMSSAKIDWICRIAFPTVFAVFNILFWLYCMRII